MLQLRFLNPRLDWVVISRCTGASRYSRYCARLIVWDESTSGKNWFQDNCEDIAWSTEMKCPFNEPFNAFPMHEIVVPHPKSRVDALEDEDVIRTACAEFKDRIPFETLSSEWRHWEEDAGSFGIGYSGLMVSRADTDYRIGLVSLFRTYDELFNSLDGITVDDIRNNGIDGGCQIIVPAKPFEEEYFRRTNN